MQQEMTLQITPPSGSFTIAPIFGAPMDSNWQSRPPKSDNLKVVKLTEENLAAVAKGLIRKGGPTVRVHKGGLEYGQQSFYVGEFVVEEYDYVKREAVFRLASVVERQKYDLR